MNLAQSERAALCDLFVTVGPDAPTLCAPWDAHDLATHLWLRERDPLAAGGYFIAPLAPLTEKHADALQEKYPYAELVAKLRRGPGFSFFGLPGVDEAANSLEYFVHHEDVRRAGDSPAEPRDLGAETEDWFWKRLRLMARVQFRKSPVGLVLEREDAATPETIRAIAGSETVTLIGRPSEIMLYAFGRKDAARVRLVGEPETVERFRATELSV